MNRISSRRLSTKTSKLCPVRSYENYTFSLNEDMEHLWQTANDAAYNRGDPKWFKKLRVGDSKLGVFMQEISALCELSKKYTNHSIRVTGATNLSRDAFTASQIMSITSHKSVNSLAMYQRVKSDEKMMMGMSLAFNLFKPQEVKNALESTQQIALPSPQQSASTEVKKRKLLPKSPAPATAPCPVIAQNTVRPAPIQSASTPQQPATSGNPIQSPQPYFDLLQAKYPDESDDDNESNFDLIKFMNEVSDNDLMIAATQMEKEYETETATSVEKSKTTIMKKSQPLPKSKGGENTNFNGCKIANIHFHIHKNEIVTTRNC